MAHTERWREERTRGIGGSDIAAIAGLSRYGSAMSVYLDKIGAGETVEQNDAMEWGTRLEETVARKFADEHPELHVLRRLHEDGDEFTFIHPDHPWAFAHIDRQLVLDAPGETPYIAVWECKTVGREGRKWSWMDANGDDMIPDAVMAQVQWEMACLGVSRGYLSVLFEGRTYREFVIERDDELIAQLLGIGEGFWKLVESRTPPSIDASDATKEVLAILYRETVDDQIDLDSEVAALAAARIEAKEAVEQQERILQGIDNQLKAALGEHKTGRAGDYLVKWSPRKGRETVSAKTLREYVEPEISEQIITVGKPYRVLDVVPTRED